MESNLISLPQHYDNKKDMERALFEIKRLFPIQNGLLPKEFVEFVGITRKSLCPYLENLKKNNSLTTDKGGYVPTFLSSADLTFNIGMFRESFVPVLDKIEPLK
jgi:hypothetical protein